jgi:hypothetical protein
MIAIINSRRSTDSPNLGVILLLANKERGILQKPHSERMRNITKT